MDDQAKNDALRQLQEESATLKMHSDKLSAEIKQLKHECESVSKLIEFHRSKGCKMSPNCQSVPLGLLSGNPLYDELRLENRTSVLSGRTSKGALRSENCTKYVENEKGVGLCEPAFTRNTQTSVVKVHKTPKNGCELPDKIPGTQETSVCPLKMLTSVKFPQANELSTRSQVLNAPQHHHVCQCKCTATVPQPIEDPSDMVVMHDDIAVYSQSHTLQCCPHQNTSLQAVMHSTPHWVADIRSASHGGASTSDMLAPSHTLQRQSYSSASSTLPASIAGQTHSKQPGQQVYRQVSSTAPVDHCKSSKQPGQWLYTQAPNTSTVGKERNFRASDILTLTNAQGLHVSEKQNPQDDQHRSHLRRHCEGNVALCDGSSASTPVFPNITQQKDLICYSQSTNISMPTVKPVRKTSTDINKSTSAKILHTLYPQTAEDYCQKLLRQHDNTITSQNNPNLLLNLGNEAQRTTNTSLPSEVAPTTESAYHVESVSTNVSMNSSWQQSVQEPFTSTGHFLNLESTKAGCSKTASEKCPMPVKKAHNTAADNLQSHQAQQWGYVARASFNGMHTATSTVNMSPGFTTTIWPEINVACPTCPFNCTNSELNFDSFNLLPDN